MSQIAAGSPAPIPMVGRQPEAIKAIPVRHPWRWVAAVVVLVISAAVLDTLLTAPSLKWSIVPRYIFYVAILEGISVTLQLTVIAMGIGIALGVVLAVMRVSTNPVLSWVSWFYIWFFRGTPALVQIFFWFNLAIVLPVIGVGIPGTPIQFHASTNLLISAFVAAAVGLGLNEGSYMAEIVRAGIISVEHGQIQAAQSLGMNELQIMRRIILPQAIRVIIPPTGNETIGMLKGTSLAFVASVPELFTRAHDIAVANYYIVEMLIVASLWYLVMTTLLTVAQHYLEQYFSRGALRNVPLTPWQQVKRFLVTLQSVPDVPVAENEVARRGLLR